MAELLTDADVLKRLEPNLGLMKVLLAFRGRADPKLAEPIQQIVRQVVDDLRRRLETQVAMAFSGSRNRFRRSQQKRMANFDAPATIRANLRHYQPGRRALIAEYLKFVPQTTRRSPQRMG